MFPFPSFFLTILLLTLFFLHFFSIRTGEEKGKWSVVKWKGKKGMTACTIVGYFSFSFSLFHSPFFVFLPVPSLCPLWLWRSPLSASLSSGSSYPSPSPFTPSASALSLPLLLLGQSLPLPSSRLFLDKISSNINFLQVSPAPCHPVFSAVLNSHAYWYTFFSLFFFLFISLISSWA